MTLKSKYLSNIINQIIVICILLIGCSEPPAHEENIPDSLPCDTLTTTFCIGEEMGDSTSMFWSIASADIDDQGRIFVLDNIECSVRAYDLQGNYLQHVTRRGPGPGELLYPRSLTVMNDGGILICASSKGGYVIFDDSLELEREIDLWANNSPYHVSPLTSTRIVASRRDGCSELEMEWHTVAIYDIDTAEYEILLYKDSLFISDCEWDANPSRALLFCDAKRLQSYGDGHGHVYVAPVDTLDYRIFGWDSLGNQILCIERGIEPVEKLPEEIANEAAFMEAVNRQYYRIPFEAKPFQHRFMIADVGIGPDGNLWARRGTRLDLYFDVYDLDGNLLSHAMYPVESYSWKTETTPYGILAWELDPLEGYHKLYFLE